MTTSGSVSIIRCHNGLSFGWPGTITAPSSALLTAASGRSRRKSASRLSASIPWQAKQFSERIGRTSRLNETADADAESVFCVKARTVSFTPAVMMKNAAKPRLVETRVFHGVSLIFRLRRSSIRVLFRIGIRFKWIIKLFLPSPYFRSCLMALKRAAWLYNNSSRKSQATTLP